MKKLAAILAASFSSQFWMREKGQPRPGVAQPQAVHLADVRKAIRSRTPASPSPASRRGRQNGSVLRTCLRRRNRQGRTHHKCGKDGESEFHEVAALIEQEGGSGNASTSMMINPGVSGQM